MRVTRPPRKPHITGNIVRPEPSDLSSPKPVGRSCYVRAVRRLDVSRQVEINHTKLIDIGDKRLGDGGMKWMLQIRRQGFSTGQRHHNAMGETHSPIGVARSALNLLHDGHEIDKTPNRIQVFGDPFLANALFEVEPSNVLRGHSALPFSDLSIKPQTLHGEQFWTGCNHRT